MDEEQKPNEFASRVCIRDGCQVVEGRIAELENERESWQAAMKYWRGLALREHSVNRRLQGVIAEAYSLLNDFEDEEAYNLLSGEIGEDE